MVTSFCFVQIFSKQIITIDFAIKTNLVNTTKVGEKHKITFYHLIQIPMIDFTIYF